MATPDAACVGGNSSPPVTHRQPSVFGDDIFFFLFTAVQLNYFDELRDGTRAKRVRLLDITLQSEPGEGVEMGHDGDLSGPSPFLEEQKALIRAGAATRITFAAAALPPRWGRPRRLASGALRPRLQREWPTWWDHPPSLCIRCAVSYGTSVTLPLRCSFATWPSGRDRSLQTGVAVASTSVTDALALSRGRAPEATTPPQ